jgi:hypothetical protein
MYTYMYVWMYVCSLCSFETIKPYTLDPYHGHNFGCSSFIMMMFLVPNCVLKCSTIIFPLVSQIGSTIFFLTPHLCNLCGFFVNIIVIVIIIIIVKALYTN